MAQLEARADERVARVALLAELRLIVAEGDRVAERAGLGEGVIPAQVEAVELRPEQHVELAELLLGQQIVRAERERGQAVARADVVGDARLVVAVVEHGALGDPREHRGGVRVARAEEHGAPALREPGLDHRAGVEQAEVALAVRDGARRGRLARHDAAREPTEARRVPARIEVDAIDHAGVDDRGPEPDVVQVRNADAVEEVTHVARRRAAHVEERQPRHDRRDPGHRLDRTKGIAERAGELAHFGARERHHRRRGLVAEHLDLGRLRGRGLRWVGRDLRRLHRGLRLGREDHRGGERQLVADARLDRRAVAGRGLELEGLRPVARARRERLLALFDPRIGHVALLVDEQLEDHDRVAHAGLGVRHVRRKDELRRDEHGLRRRLRENRRRREEDRRGRSDAKQGS